MTIVEFLLARIGEDEALARAADASRWRGEDKGITFDVYSDKFDDGEAMARLDADTRANQDHIINWSPARVRAECAAKRAILEDHAPTVTSHIRYGYDAEGESFPLPYVPACRQCTKSVDTARVTSDWDVADRIVAPCDTVRIMAAVYSDHPDFDPAWR